MIVYLTATTGCRKYFQMGHILYLPVILAVATGWLLLLTTTFVPESDASQNLKVVKLMNTLPTA